MTSKPLRYPSLCPGEAGPLDVIARLRRIVEWLDGDDDDGVWLGACLGRYLAEASEGTTLEGSFGLTPRPGQASWWNIEARERRDRAFYELWRHYHPSLGAAAAGDAILAEVRRYRATRWRRDQTAQSPPASYAGTRDALLFEIMKSLDGAVPETGRRICLILNSIS